MKDKEYLTTSETAKFLFRSEEWVREQIKNGRIKARHSSSRQERMHNKIHISEVERMAIEIYSDPKTMQDLKYKVLAKLLGISYKTVKKGYGPGPEDKE